MVDDNTPPGGAGDDGDTLLTGGEVTPPEGDPAPPGDGDPAPEPEFQLDDDGKQILGEDGNPIPVEPETEYTDFTMPEGVEVDTELMGIATPVLKELGLSQDQAQKVIDLHANFVASQNDAMVNQVSEWQKEARSNKEYGGENLNANVTIAQKALSEYANEGLITFLNDTGIGNHPDVIDFMVKVGKTLSEDTPGLGDSGDNSNLSRQEKMYGKDTA